MLEDWVFYYLPRIFCGFTYVVNPVFIYLIFTEKSSQFGNYRFLLLFFAVFNMIYSVMNFLIQIDIHSYRYCFFLFLKNNWFPQSPQLNFHLLLARCSMLAASYGVLLIHFIYRYLIMSNSTLTNEKFHWYLTGSAVIIMLYFWFWYFLCWFSGEANLETRQYIRDYFQSTFGSDSMDSSMLTALYNEASLETKIRSWNLISSASALSILSIITFFILARLIMQKLENLSVTSSVKTSKFQFELLRALIVQTVVPIFISFSPCFLCWYSPIFGIQLNRGFNYFEVSALAVFSFVDPVAIILCVPIFRARVFCNRKNMPTSKQPTNHGDYQI
ncbi:Serpentine Receptor, class J [Caenorhabditis elegans]|uniref:Serpentine Receptor, class J n=1 Tax=Caenorhabditis elegans TaxID=6239 RepID=O16987_CAEEL|nr:Serpentine Receptor, class J [Caenorhabditis elegans]CCD71818.1 Serpentine Receptor, class J [Caenorhabditis elegans]|eukprot:NP_503770.1 Serpentine Receptor, class J [Caenorhabditis elegans]